MNVTLERIRTVCGQWAVVQLAIRSKIVEWLVKGTGRIPRVTSCYSTVSLVGCGETGIVPPQSAPGVAEHSRPSVSCGLCDPELDTIVVTNRQRLGWGGPGRGKNFTGIGGQ